MDDEKIEQARRELAELGDSAARIALLEKSLAESVATIEQLRVQLAGCSVAANGGTSTETRVVQGQYGWSVAYQDTLDLRLKYDDLRADLAAAREAILWYADHAIGLYGTPSDEVYSAVRAAREGKK